MENAACQGGKGGVTSEGEKLYVCVSFSVLVFSLIFFFNFYYSFLGQSLPRRVQAVSLGERVCDRKLAMAGSFGDPEGPSCIRRCGEGA